MPAIHQIEESDVDYPGVKPLMGKLYPAGLPTTFTMRQFR
jgi:hypothetical protein